MTDVCMIFDENGNAFDAFEYEPDELEARALEFRRERGEITTVTIGPSPFLLAGSTSGPADLGGRRMTGVEIRAQVMDALSYWQSMSLGTTGEAREALAPCVVLTEEEADEIIQGIGIFPGHYARAVALLAPQEIRAGDAG